MCLQVRTTSGWYHRVRAETSGLRTFIAESKPQVRLTLHGVAIAPAPFVKSNGIPQSHRLWNFPAARSCRLPSRDIAVRARAEIVAAAEHAAATGLRFVHSLAARICGPGHLLLLTV